MKDSKYKLTAEQRDQVVGMLLRKDRIQDIAYYFGKSPATIHGVKEKLRKGILSYMGLSELPPRGPYALVTHATVEKAAAFDSLKARHEAALSVISKLENLIHNLKVECGLGVTVPNEQTIVH